MLMGGWDGEREVSLSSAAGCLKALRDRGHHVVAIDVTQDIPRWLTQIVDLKPDVIFMNALHGQWVEDGCTQGVLEMLGFPYTNSGLLASALAMDKCWSRQLFEQAGIQIPKGKVVLIEELENPNVYPYPFVVKPINKGSSLGVSIVHTPEELKKAYQEWTYGSHVLLEEYIPGRELAVAIMGDRALGVIEIQPKRGFRDFENKYTAGKEDRYLPARIPKADYELAMEMSLKAAQVLGCRGVSRTDLRYDDTRSDGGQMYLLEINSQSGMTPLSLVPEIAAYCNISFGELLEWMIDNPICPEENPVIKNQTAIDVDKETFAVSDLMSSSVPA